MYRGFSFTEERQAIDDTLRQALSDQVDIVLAVGLDPTFVEFFRSVPLAVVPPGAVARQSPGLYQPRDRAVRLTGRMAFVGHKPVLLHELLHAYHHQRMPGGFSNATVGALYKDAKENQRFELRSHMMVNRTEFFACAGTTYLFGVTAQEPFRRDRIKNDPELLRFLQATFGPSCGTFDGVASGAHRAAAAPAARP